MNSMPFVSMDGEMSQPQDNTKHGEQQSLRIDGKLPLVLNCFCQYVLQALMTCFLFSLYLSLKCARLSPDLYRSPCTGVQGPHYAGSAQM